MFALVPLIVLFPLAGVIVNTFFGRQLGPNRSAWLAVTMAALAFTIGLFQLGGLAGNGGQPITVPVATWLSVGDLHVDWAFQVDALSVTHRNGRTEVIDGFEQAGQWEALPAGTSSGSSASRVMVS